MRERGGGVSVEGVRGVRGQGSERGGGVSGMEYGVKIDKQLSSEWYFRFKN